MILCMLSHYMFARVAEGDGMRRFVSHERPSQLLYSTRYTVLSERFELRRWEFISR